ncbi:MAG: Glu/Leu/Phe/Val dehydrogenase dimerization domain-containing protein [Desulfohalobiaceae bacterium]
MQIMQAMQERDFEQVIFCQDKDSNLKAVIAIHSTALGPALGGTRMCSYGTEQEALEDALRLAKGMSYKAAVAGLPKGGGKGVIIGDPEQDKSQELFQAYGRFIDRLHGWYITAEDAGTCPEDMDCIRTCTSCVLGTSQSGGDPSPWTALGVRQGMQASLKYLTGSADLQGKTVAVQGAGHVGRNLCRLLTQDGAKLLVADIRQDRARQVAEEFGAQLIPAQEILQTACDILAPCALGGVINNSTLPGLKCSIIAGAANNILQEPKQDQALADMGILYVPDYVINAGGLICVADQLEGFDQERVHNRVLAIQDTCLEIFDLAQQEGLTPAKAADRVAEERMSQAAAQKSSGLHQPEHKPLTASRLKRGSL